jgi:uncharacterized protein
MTLSQNYKVIFDTNIFISAFALQGTTGEIISKINYVKVKIQYCDELLEEIRKILVYKFKVDNNVFQRTIEFIVKRGKRHKIKIDLRISRDPKDDFLLSLAEKSNAGYLVTGDSDLLVLENFGKTKIITFKEFIDILNKT